jgi:UDP-glucose 6-dehydrogenase
LPLVQRFYHTRYANVRQGSNLPPSPRAPRAAAVFNAVGTPSRRGDGHADLSFVYEAVREIAPYLSLTAVVITKSTVPVGTGDEIGAHHVPLMIDCAVLPSRRLRR